MKRAESDNGRQAGLRYGSVDRVEEAPPEALPPLRQVVLPAAAFNQGAAAIAFAADSYQAPLDALYGQAAA